MKIDNRLEHAFSDLENRVSQHLKTRPVEPPTAVPNKTRPYLYAGFAVAAAFIVVVTATLALGPNTPAPTPADTVPDVTVPNDPQTTVPPPDDSAPVERSDASLIPLAGFFAISVDTDGVIGHDSDGASLILSAEAAGAHPYPQGGLVYVATDDPNTLRLVDASGNEEVLTVEAGRIRLFEVLDDGRVLHTVRSGSEENQVEQLYQTTRSGTVALDFASGGEGSVYALSGTDNLLVIQTGSEGGLFTTGFVPGQGAVEVPGLPETECFNGFDEVGLCHWYTSITDDGARFISLYWSGNASVPAELVVTMADNGAVEYRVALDGAQFTGIDVAWPNVVVNRQIVVGGDWAPGTATVVSFGTSQPTLFELSTSGVASANN